MERDAAATPDRLVRAFCGHPFLLLLAACLLVGALFNPLSSKLAADGTLLLVLAVLTLAGAFIWRKKAAFWRDPVFLLIPAAAVYCILFLNSGLKTVFLGLTGLFALLGAGAHLYAAKALTARRLLWLIAAAGFLLRVVYILYTPVEVRQHDVERFGFGSGHSGYIEYIYQHLSLPDSDPSATWQFYHPPLHHTVAALWLRLLTFSGMPWGRALENLQILTLFYSGLILIFSRRLFAALGLRGKGLLAAFALIALHPTMIILSGSVNNDILSVALVFGAVLYAVKWYKKPAFGTVVKLALFIGGAMLAKLSGGLVAPAVALLFLLKFIGQKGGRGALFRQFPVFAAVCLPLGLWWSARNWFLFDLSPGYVPSLGVNSHQYIGYRSVAERLFDFSSAQFKTVFVAWGDPHYDYNPLLGLLKTGVFGEYAFAQRGTPFYAVCAALFWAGVLVALAAFAAMLAGMFRRDLLGSRGLRAFFGALYLTYMVSYFRFCFAFPHTCTMDIRYAVPTILTGAVFFGLLLQKLEKRKGKPAEILSRSLSAAALLFCCLSAAVYVGISG